MNIIQFVLKMIYTFIDYYTLHGTFYKTNYSVHYVWFYIFSHNHSLRGETFIMVTDVCTIYWLVRPSAPDVS